VATLATIAQPLSKQRQRVARVRPSLWLGLTMLAVLLLVALFAGHMTPFDPIKQDFGAILLPPSGAHPFGTDNFGRDVFARVLHGTAIDLKIGLLSIIFPSIFGAVVGSLAGYFGGAVDSLLMRLVDVVTAFPFLVLVIAIVAFLGGGLTNMLIAIGAVGWVPYARLVRAEVMVQKSMEYIQAARVLGFGRWRIIFRHVMPNAITAAFVYMVSDVMLNILTGSALGFLGLGVRPPAPEWGLMISEGRSLLYNAWWIATMPGLACLFAGVTFSVLGDGLADLLRVKGQ
jgi:peptide/nickel transport system permease protein